MTENCPSNPFESPKFPTDSKHDSQLLPVELTERTRKVVNRFGLFQSVWPVLAAYWTDQLFIDVVAFVIAANGRAIQRTSFTKFPWTSVLCAAYPVAFIVSAVMFGVTDWKNWIPSRFSPVLLLQFVSACWAIYAISLIWKCYGYRTR